MDSLKQQVELDQQFIELNEAIDARSKALDKLQRVRVKNWLAKLQEPTNNLTWKRNRNQYARLMMHQLGAGVLDEPFDVNPPDTALPTLQPYMLYRFMSPNGRSSSPPLRHDPFRTSLESPRRCKTATGTRTTTGSHGTWSANMAGPSSPAATRGRAAAPGPANRHRCASATAVHPRKGHGGSSATQNRPFTGLNPAAYMHMRDEAEERTCNIVKRLHAAESKLQAQARQLQTALQVNAATRSEQQAAECSIAAMEQARAAAKTHVDMVLNRCEQRKVLWGVKGGTAEAQAATQGHNNTNDNTTAAKPTARRDDDSSIQDNISTDTNVEAPATVTKETGRYAFIEKLQVDQVLSPVSMQKADGRKPAKPGSSADVGRAIRSKPSAVPVHQVHIAVTPLNDAAENPLQKSDAASVATQAPGRETTESAFPFQASPFPSLQGLLDELNDDDNQNRRRPLSADARKRAPTEAGVGNRPPWRPSSPTVRNITPQRVRRQSQGGSTPRLSTPLVPYTASPGKGRSTANTAAASPHGFKMSSAASPCNNSILSTKYKGIISITDAADTEGDTCRQGTQTRDVSPELHSRAVSCMSSPRQRSKTPDRGLAFSIAQSFNGSVMSPNSRASSNSLHEVLSQRAADLQQQLVVAQEASKIQAKAVDVAVSDAHEALASFELSLKHAQSTLEQALSEPQPAGKPAKSQLAPSPKREWQAVQVSFAACKSSIAAADAALETCSKTLSMDDSMDVASPKSNYGAHSSPKSTRQSLISSGQLRRSEPGVADGNKTPSWRPGGRAKARTPSPSLRNRSPSPNLLSSAGGYQPAKVHAQKKQAAFRSLVSAIAGLKQQAKQLIPCVESRVLKPLLKQTTQRVGSHAKQHQLQATAAANATAGIVNDVLDGMTNALGELQATLAECMNILGAAVGNATSRSPSPILVRAAADADVKQTATLRKSISQARLDAESSLRRLHSQAKLDGGLTQEDQMIDDAFETMREASRLLSQVGGLSRGEEPNRAAGLSKNSTVGIPTSHINTSIAQSAASSDHISHNDSTSPLPGVCLFRSPIDIQSPVSFRTSAPQTATRHGMMSSSYDQGLRGVSLAGWQRSSPASAQIEAPCYGRQKDDSRSSSMHTFHRSGKSLPSIPAVEPLLPSDLLASLRCEDRPAMSPSYARSALLRASISDAYPDALLCANNVPDAKDPLMVLKTHHEPLLPESVRQAVTYSSAITTTTTGKVAQNIAQTGRSLRQPEPIPTLVDKALLAEGLDNVGLMGGPNANQTIPSDQQAHESAPDYHNTAAAHDVAKSITAAGDKQTQTAPMKCQSQGSAAALMVRGAQASIDLPSPTTSVSKPIPGAITAVKSAALPPLLHSPKVTVEDLNSQYRKGIGAVRAAEAENLSNLHAFQAAKQQLGLTDVAPLSPV